MFQGTTLQPYFPENLSEYAPWVAAHGLIEPYGQCQCRCGQKTELARCTDRTKGWRKDHPLRFVHRHQSRKYQTLEEAFWANTKVKSNTECWEWQSKSIASGYGLIWACGSHITAHRFSYELHYGPIPPGMSCLHSCDNKLCVNPHHLRIGTTQDNVNDAIERRLLWDESGKHPCAKLSPQEIVAIRGLADSGADYKSIAAIYDVDPTNIGCIVRGETWKHI